MFSYLHDIGSSTFGYIPPKAMPKGENKEEGDEFTNDTPFHRNASVAMRRKIHKIACKRFNKTGFDIMNEDCQGESVHIYDDNHYGNPLIKGDGNEDLQSANQNQNQSSSKKKISEMSGNTTLT